MTDLQTGFATINGAQLYYEVAGQGNTLIFVHAGIAHSGMWDTQFAFFAAHYRVIRFDMRGYGQSAPVAGEYTNRADLYALLEFLNVTRAAVIGCSMGGGASMDFALEHPEMAAALVMVGSGPTGLVLDVPMSSLEPAIQQAETDQNWELMNELETQLWFDGEGRTPDQVDQTARAQLLAMNRQAIEHARSGLGKHAAPMQPAAVERLGDLHLPVLVIYGDRDEPYIRAAAPYMAEHIADVQVRLMPNTAHLPNMERPAEFNQIVADFLTAHGWT